MLENRREQQQSGMHEALKALNQLVAERVIVDYAIGGAIGAAFYISAAQTAQGGVVEREYVRFGNWPVPILTDANSLIAEAIRQAVPVDYDGTPTRVFRAEHLCAVALQTGRTKDYLRVEMFLEQGAVNREALIVLAKFGLSERML